MAQEGASLKDIADELALTAGHIGSLGVCTKPGSLPGRPPMHDLEPGEIEIGGGIDGEPGVVKMPVSALKIHFF